MDKGGKKGIEVERRGNWWKEGVRGGKKGIYVERRS